MTLCHLSLLLVCGSPIYTFRGVRQGFPLSLLLFALAIETSAEVLKENPDIHALTVVDRQYKISLYANDIPIFLIKPKLSISILTATMSQENTMSMVKYDLGSIMLQG